MENADNGKITENIKGKTEEILESIAQKIEKMRTLDYVFFVEHPFKRIGHNFVNGIARGVGSAVGFSIVFAVLIMVLEWIGATNVPIISDLVKFILNLTKQ